MLCYILHGCNIHNSRAAQQLLRPDGQHILQCGVPALKQAAKGKHVASQKYAQEEATPTTSDADPRQLERRKKRKKSPKNARGKNASTCLPQ